MWQRLSCQRALEQLVPFVQQLLPVPLEFTSVSAAPARYSAAPARFSAVFARSYAVESSCLDLSISSRSCFDISALLVMANEVRCGNGREPPILGEAVSRSWEGACFAKMSCPGKCQGLRLT